MRTHGVRADRACAICAENVCQPGAAEGESSRFQPARTTFFGREVSESSNDCRSSIGKEKEDLREAPEDVAEQEAIAEALSDADALIEGLERLIAKKRLIKQGAMQDLLTAKRRLPGFSGEWVDTKLRSVLKGVPSYGINAATSPLGSGGYE